MKLYKVEASFDDYDSFYYITICLCSDKENAEDLKNKWETFFSEKKALLKEPEGWDKEDWFDSEEYHDLLYEYKEINKFQNIEIFELDLNKEVFLQNFPYSEKLTRLMKEFDRNWKLNKII
jgi:hypothetical protein